LTKYSLGSTTSKKRLTWEKRWFFFIEINSNKPVSYLTDTYTVS
jgi:hypothetical protein